MSPERSLIGSLQLHGVRPMENELWALDVSASVSVLLASGL